MNAVHRFPRGPRAATALLCALVALLCLALLPAAHADDTGGAPGGDTSGSGKVKNADGTLKFGIGPSNHLPAKQVVDGRPYLVYSANPGATILDRIAIFNYDRKPLTLQVYATDAVQSDTGAFGLLPGDDTPADAGSWIRLLDVPKSGTVTVPGRTGKAYGVLRVRFIARIPAKTTPGDHVGGLIASLKSTSRNKKGARITLDQRIGVRAYFAVSGDLAPRLAIEDLHAGYQDQWDPRGRGRYTVSYYLHNTGNLRLKVAQDVTVSRCILGKVLCPAGSLVGHPATQPDLLPGTRIKVTQVFPHRFGLGHLSATVTLHPTALDESYTKRIPDVSASVGFWALPWLLILIILLVLVVAGVGGWRFERRRRRRARERALAASAPAPKHAAPLPEDDDGGALRARLAAMVAVLKNLTVNRASRNEG